MLSKILSISFDIRNFIQIHQFLIKISSGNHTVFFFNVSVQCSLFGINAEFCSAGPCQHISQSVHGMRLNSSNSLSSALHWKSRDKVGLKILKK